MKKCCLLILAALAFSCEDYKVHKISSEQIFNEEAKQINWKQVDEFPAFDACKEVVVKKIAKDCFEQKISEYINTEFGKNKIEVAQSFHDTLFLFLKISEKGEPKIERLFIDSTITNQLPQVEQWLQNSVDSLPKIYPASKRGIPVSTVFKLPVVIVAD